MCKYVRQVLIIDFDVHHGNGTQELVEGDESILYVSLHRHEGGSFYPGTGGAADVGSCGNCVNTGWNVGGVRDGDYLAAWHSLILPIATQFKPDIAIVSAGFDAALGDPIGGCCVSTACYSAMIQMTMSVCRGRVMVLLEGGYNLASISAAAEACVQTLLGDRASLPHDTVPTAEGLSSIAAAAISLQPFWSVQPIGSPSLYEKAQRRARREKQREEQEVRALRRPRARTRKVLSLWRGVGRKVAIVRAMRKKCRTSLGKR